MIAIIGGGTAGTMCATHLSRALPHHPLYHIYDPALPAIGVGEGTLPSFRHWLHTLTDLSFAELQAQYGITLKRGIRFEGWGQRHPQFNHYFQDEATAYHISAAQITPLLAQYSRATLLNRRLLAIEREGTQARLVFAEGEPLRVNLVVDARGFPPAGEATAVPLTVIPTQAALLRRGNPTPFQEATRAVARPHGWIFVIPLTTHTSYGYIYNPTLSSQTAVSTDFDTFFRSERLPLPAAERLLPFPNYRQQQFFDGLIYKIGNAASFLEPLEATAIGLTLYQIYLLTDWLKQPADKRPLLIPHINRDLTQSIEAISLFVGWHYAHGSRYDTPFWHFAQQNFATHWQQARETAVGRAFHHLYQAGQQPTPAPMPDIFFGGFTQASFAQIGQGIGAYSPKIRTPMTPQPFSLTLLQQAHHTLQQALQQQQPIHLRHLVSPETIAYLFQAELATRLKTGAPVAPLLQAAQAAVAHGELSLKGIADMRQQLTHAANTVYEAGGWQPTAPLWWHPLPPLSPSEQLWQQLQTEQHPALPATALLQETFAPTGRHWLMVPTFLPPDLTEQIHPHLEAAFQNGRLPLERGGIGNQGSHQHQRTDWVRYLTGHETDIWREVPALGALVQWCRRTLATHFSVAEPLFTPQTAMLSRYPAQSAGYAPHIDNPSQTADNGRALTLVIYLNAPDQLCSGGEIAVWDKGQLTSQPAAAMMPPTSGAAILFNARTIPHQVRPVADGPARWALSLWFNNAAELFEPPLPTPQLSLTDILLPIAHPPLPADKLLFHETAPSQLIVRQRSTATPNVGLVATVYGQGTQLEAWCDYHLSLGMAHLILIFDHWHEAAEQETAVRLRNRYSQDQLTIWSSAQLAQTVWPTLPATPQLLAAAQHGQAAQAVAARQTLNATAALQAAQRGELGKRPLDWLLHLDSDERFRLEGAARGGATLAEHFATLQAANYTLVNYLNHELLLPQAADQPPRFKINPTLAQLRLGKNGWQAMVNHLHMGSDAPRPYFHGYNNGKTAVFVPHALAAAGVHSWTTAVSHPCTLAGPSILHYRQPTADDFCQKYLAIAASPVPAEEQIFPLAPMEATAVRLIHTLQQQGADHPTLLHHLHQLYQTSHHFSPSDIALLAEANLLTV